MRLFYSPHQSLHDPAVEMHNGGFAAYREHSGRVASILAAITATEAPADFGLAPLAAVHTTEYLAFLQTAHGRWLDAGREGDALPYVWPVRHRRPLHLERIDALLGRFSFDGTTPITATTWRAAYAGAQSALAATQAVLDGAHHAFALSRPPGHHAGADYMGGYCYLNAAAIAAQHAREAGKARIAILDVDYHHGNGAQDIFWERGDVFYCSVHADPATDYPFFWGHADEVGIGAGANLNIPLAQGTDWTAYCRALRRALSAVTDFLPDLLVVSYGADTFAGDPICSFSLRTPDFTALGADIASVGLPTVILMEGGYATDHLGMNVAAFLSAFARKE